MDLKNNSSIKKDTVTLTAVSIFLQAMSLLLNIFITKKLGSQAMGIASLIYSFYAFIITLSNGNVFTATSRFVSEEIGKKSGNPNKIALYSLRFGLGLSFIFAISIFAFASKIGAKYLDGEPSAAAIRLMAISLPIATAGSCLKGFFHAKRMVKKPCISDLMEFSAKALVIFLCAEFLIPNHKTDILNAIATSIVIGEIISCSYLCISFLIYIKSSPCQNRASIASFPKYLKAILPIVLNAYIFVVLSSTNEAIVPLALKNYNGSTETALAEYGILEGIIFPVIFFPSVLLQSLSCILVPEIARHNSSHNRDKIQSLAKNALQKSFSWAILVAFALFACGERIGNLACDDPLAGNTLKIMCLVIPFIYMEMIFESILKGLGMQNFSTVNSAVEYIIRITAVAVFVPIFGFNGIIISYFASNIICNLVRIIAVTKATGLKFDFCGFILIPVLCGAASWQFSNLAIYFLSPQNDFFYTAIYILLLSILFISMQTFIEKFAPVKFKA
ncbi:MAG: stage sporulation protein [Clostridiales bacterium]|jgi:stage V sporulation protein B|nr:stage sporulation protein [Clostridiales bacterium]